MTMMSDLPGDLVEEILCRVPAISLKRLRSSCKRWNHLFNDKEFAKKHFHKAPKQSSFVLTLNKEFKICLMSLNLHGTPSLESKGEHSLFGYSNQVLKVLHCDGLLLCIFYKDTRMMLWNPCTGGTRWIQPIDESYTYAIGSYQESSYKILGFSSCKVNEFAIYEVNSNSWRILDVIRDFELLYSSKYVSLKGKSYWFAYDRTKDEQLDMLLVSFDYTTERFERLSLPFNCPSDCFRDATLSVVSEEKLAVLLRRENTRGKEIWVSNKIDGTKGVLWRKILTVNFPKRDIDIWYNIGRFSLNEEKKVALCCQTSFFTMKKLVYVAGEDYVVKRMGYGGPILILDYVPSLVQIP